MVKNMNKVHWCQSPSALSYWPGADVVRARKRTNYAESVSSTRPLVVGTAA
jgi:hypothetical protein